MADAPATAERSIAPTEAQAVPKVSPGIGSDISAEKRHNFLYNLIHRGKKASTKPVVVEPVPTPVAAVKRAEPAPAKPLTPAQIKRAELQKRIAEAGEKEGLKVALEGRLEDWHTKISDWLIRTQGVPDPMSMRESLSRFGQLVMDPELQVEDSKRQGAEMARDVLGVADKLVTSIRLRLGGPYSKGGQNGSDN